MERRVHVRQRTIFLECSIVLGRILGELQRHSRHLRTACVLAVLCSVVTLTCYAQQELQSSAISLVPPEHAAIETATEYNGRIYAVHTGGGLMSYSTTLGDAQRVEYFHGVAVSKVYVYNGVMIVVTFNGQYYFTTDGIDFTALNVQARMECRMPDMQPYMWTPTGLVTISVSSANVTVLTVSSIPCPPLVTSFVVVGDTILAKSSSTSSEANENEIKRWHIRGDTLPTLIPDSLPRDGYRQLVMLSNGWIGAMRYSDVFVSDPREGAGIRWSPVLDPLNMIRPLSIQRLYSATLPFRSTVFEWSNLPPQEPEFYSFIDSTSLIERVRTPSIAPIMYPSCFVHLEDAQLLGARENNVLIVHDSMYRQLLQVPVINHVSNASVHFTNGRPVLLAPLVTPPPANTSVIAGFTYSDVLYPFGSRQSNMRISDVVDVIHEDNRVYLLTDAGMLEYDVQSDSLRRLSDEKLSLSANGSTSVVNDDTLIVISPRRIRVSTNAGKDWSVKIAPKLFRGVRNAYKVGDYVVANAIDAIATIHIREILGKDTVDVTMWNPRNASIMRLAGTVNDKATVVVGHPRNSVPINHVFDTLTVYTVDPATLERDSVDIIPDQSVFSSFTAFWLKDTLRIVNMAAGRHIDVVGSKVVRDVSYTQSPLQSATYDGDVRILPDSTGYIIFYSAYSTADVVQLFPPDTTTSTKGGGIEQKLHDMYAEMYIDGVQPNPNRGAFRVVIGRHPQADPATAQLRLYDINGNLVTDLTTMLNPQQAYGTKHVVDVTASDLPAGTYLMTIENHGRKDVKIVKIVR